MKSINQPEGKMYICFQLLLFNSFLVFLEVIISFVCVCQAWHFHRHNVKQFTEHTGGQAHFFHDLWPSCAIV